jgi:hypothetical protein
MPKVKEKKETSKFTSQELVDRLLEREGLTLDDAMHGAIFDGVSPGICKRCGEYTTEVEPDQAHGHCEECETQTVVSLARLLGVI